MTIGIKVNVDKSELLDCIDMLYGTFNRSMWNKEDAEVFLKLGNRIITETTLPNIKIITGEVRVIRNNSEDKPAEDYISGDGWGANHQPGGIIVTHNQSIVFKQDTGPRTNNYREILALQNAVKIASNSFIHVVYSDSDTALSWVEKGKPNTVDDISDIIILIRSIRSMIEYGDIILKKWNTRNWGQIPSDAGRK